MTIKIKSFARDHRNIIVVEGQKERKFFKQLRPELTASLQVKMLGKAAKRNCDPGCEGRIAHLEGGIRTTQQDPGGRGKVSPGSKVVLERGPGPVSITHTHAHTPVALGHLEKKQNQFEL